MNAFVKAGLLALCAALAACSVLEGDKIDYRSATKSVSLEVPPDLTQLSRDSRFVVPGGPVTASSMQAAQASAPGIPTASQTLGDVRIERAGNQRWLVSDAPPEVVFDPSVLALMDKVRFDVHPDYEKQLAKYKEDAEKAKAEAEAAAAALAAEQIITATELTKLVPKEKKKTPVRLAPSSRPPQIEIIRGSDLKSVSP